MQSNQSNEGDVGLYSNDEDSSEGDAKSIIVSTEGECSSDERSSEGDVESQTGSASISNSRAKTRDLKPSPASAVGASQQSLLVEEEETTTLACAIDTCNHRSKSKKALCKHFGVKHAKESAVIPDLSYVNGMGLTQCRHCFGLYNCNSEGIPNNHKSCAAKLMQDKRDKEAPKIAANRARIAFERTAKRLEEGKTAPLCKKDAAEVARARGQWVPHTQHGLVVWLAVSGGLLEDFLDALESGPDANSEAQATIIKFLQTPQQVMEWNKAGEYQEVGDGTGVEPPVDDAGEVRERDAAKVAATQLTKVGQLLSEGLSRKALKVLLRKPLLEINTTLWSNVKLLLAMEPRAERGAPRELPVGAADDEVGEEGDGDPNASDASSPQMPEGNAEEPPVDVPGPDLRFVDVGHEAPITEKSVRAYVSDLDRLESSRDILGWHVRDFKMLINCPKPRVREALVKMLRFIASGSVTDPALLALLRFGLGHAIDKNGDGKAVRPAVSGVHLVQIPESIMVREYSAELGGLIGQFNVCNGSPQEALSAAVQLAAAQHPAKDITIAKGDIRNAHSSIDREVAQELAEELPALRGLIEVRYGGATEGSVVRIGYINTSKKLVYIVESKRGVIQGAPLATAIFTRAYNKVIDQVRRTFKDVTIIGIADDTYFIGAFDEVLGAWKLAVKLADEQLGLTFRPDKSAAWFRDPSQVTEAQLQALAAVGIPQVDGFMVAGTPHGTLEFVISVLEETVAGIREKADSIAAVCASNTNTVQALFTTATLGLASMFNHLLRTLPPDVVRQHARRVDGIAVECARKVLGLQHVPEGSEASIDMRERLFMHAPGGGMGMMECAAVVDAAYIGHWGLVGPAVQAMLPKLALTEAATLQLAPLLALQKAAERVAAAATASEIKRMVGDLPMLLSNRSKGLQGEISRHQAEVKQERYVKSMPTGTAEQKARKRAFVSGASKEGGAALHASRRFRLNRLTDAEYRVNCALRLGVNANAPPQQQVQCPDCKMQLTDLTAHALACGNIKAQPNRTRLHTAMDVAARTLLTELVPSLVVTGSKDAYPSDHGLAVSAAHPEAINHRADACVFDTATGDRHLIDFTFTNAAGLSGEDGAEPGFHADVAEGLKIKQYAEQFPDFKQSSDPSLVILCMERHGSWSKGTRQYWDERVQAAHQRQAATREIPTPLSVFTRRVLQTLAIALWRSNASHILQFHRRACHSARRVVGSGVVEELVAGPGGGI